LFGDHDDGLDRESPSTSVEKVLKRGTEKIDDEDIVEAFLSEVINVRDTG
jgi:hypothetical protein